MNATMVVLYTEELVKYDDSPIRRDNHPVDRIEVTVRAWTAEGKGGSDVVIESSSTVNGRKTHAARHVYPYNKSKAWFIRLGIDTFDLLHTMHPNLSNMPREDTND